MTPELISAHWIKSRFCSSDGCVEVAQLTGGAVAIRDSKNTDLPPHVFDREEWVAFIRGAKDGDFDFAG